MSKPAPERRGSQATRARGAPGGKRQQPRQRLRIEMMQEEVGDESVELPFRLEPVKYIGGDNFRAPSAFFESTPDRGRNRGLPVNKTDFHVWPLGAKRLSHAQ